MEFCQNEFLVTNFILRHDPAGMLLMGIHFFKKYFFLPAIMLYLLG
jgi:hypothetical protein